jgi:hypothetical protein
MCGVPGRPPAGYLLGLQRASPSHRRDARQEGQLSPLRYQAEPTEVRPHADWSDGDGRLSSRSFAETAAVAAGCPLK